MIKPDTAHYWIPACRGYDGPLWSYAPRDRERVFGRRVLPSLRGALATKQSTLSSRHGLLRFARNDELGCLKSESVV